MHISHAKADTNRLQPCPTNDWICVFLWCILHFFSFFLSVVFLIFFFYNMLWIWSSSFACFLSIIHVICYLKSVICSVFFWDLWSSPFACLLDWWIKTWLRLCDYYFYHSESVNVPLRKEAAGCKRAWRYDLWKVSLTVDMTSGHSSHVSPLPPAWHLSIISLVGMPGSCHHHHGNVSVLPVAITMAMGVSPSNHQHGPNVSLLTRITMAICACRNTKPWHVCGNVCVRGKKKR